MEPQKDQTLGHYRFVEKIGEGGMGVVWKGLDTRLDREVAIKLLPATLAEDPERVERFSREAKVLASLNHPNIAGIYGLEEEGGRRFLVMELVPGQDLLHRIQAGPLPVEEALEAARQIADGLEAAHDSGIIHRDLKPANIQITPEGKIRILDFGLAKAFEPEIDPASGSMSPTLTTPATRAGVILGTAAYMSPEQAKGKKVDRRTDIWAFGCVLYEMLTRRRAFKGDGVSETLASVIMGSIDLSALPAGTPPAVRRLLERCLEKDPRRRLRDIGEARFVLEETLAGRGSEAAEDGAEAGSRSASRISLPLLAGVAVIAAAIAGAAAWFLRPAAPEPPLRRLEIPVTGIDRSFVSGRTVEISPDGTRVAWAIGDKIRIRPLDTLEPREVHAAGNVAYIFWSPDSAWLAFSAGGRLWKVVADGGEPVAIADQDAGLQGGSGATWSPDGSIIMGTGEGGISSVPSQGGDITSFVKLDADKETDLHQPEALPDGSGVLFVPHKRSGRPDSLVLFSKGQRKELFRIEGQTIWDPVYSPTGHILFRREPKNPGIWALPFSLKTHEVTGDPFLVVQDGTMPSVSDDGTLVYVRGYDSQKCRLAIIDRDGKETARLGGEEQYWPFPTFSPDGTKVAVSIRLDDADDIWIYDIQRQSRTRLTFGARLAGQPFWSHDGQWIYYHEGQAGPPFKMFRKRVDGSGTPEPLGTGFRPTVTSDGRYLVFVEESEKSKIESYDIYYQDLEKKGEPVQLAKDPGIQYAARVSPDGTLVAYASTESGAPEVFIRRFPTGDGKWQVSVGGGGWPRWSRAGDRIYYAKGTGIYEVEIERPSGGMQLSAPRLAFTTKDAGISIPNGWDPGYDISPDGRTAVVVEPSGEMRPSSNIIVVENWLSQFRGQH